MFQFFILISKSIDLVVIYIDYLIMKLLERRKQTFDSIKNELSLSSIFHFLIVNLAKISNIVEKKIQHD